MKKIILYEKLELENKFKHVKEHQAGNTVKRISILPFATITIELHAEEVSCSLEGMQVTSLQDLLKPDPKNICL